MPEQDDEKTASDNPLKERDFALRERELALKEKEVEAKIKLDRKGLWFTSPLLIGGITAIAGLIGTGIGAVLQGNANFKLERQKFEFALIQKALQSPNQNEAAKQLLFLINSGVIVSLDGEKIRNIAENNPSQLPVLVPNTATSLEVFFNRYTTNFGTLSLEGKAALTQIFSFIEKDKDIQDIRYVAYILATIKHETRGTYQPLSEFGSDEIIEKRYGVNTSRGMSEGNTQPGDGSRYKGRGYILITFKNNYQLMNKELGLINTDSDLVVHPEKALEPQIAYRILAKGMKMGNFTGRKLSDYITDDKTDYVNARRILNGLDKAQEIANNAKTFEAILRDSLASR